MRRQVWPGLIMGSAKLRWQPRRTPQLRPETECPAGGDDDAVEGPRRETQVLHLALLQGPFPVVAGKRFWQGTGAIRICLENEMVINSMQQIKSVLLFSALTIVALYRSCNLIYRPKNRQL